MTVMSLRLGDRAMKIIREMSRMEERDRSAVVRELIEEGWLLHLFRLYREKKVSLGGLSKSLGRSLSETLDLLSEFGQTAPIEYEDYLQGQKTAAKLI
jgi:predicted HTH domain antitoxin